MPKGIYTRTEEMKKAMTLSHLGHIPWNKGIKMGKNPEHSIRMKGRKVSDETKRKTSLSLKGRIPKNIKSISGWNKGINHTIETKLKISKFRTGKLLGSKNHLWRGGKTKLQDNIRTSFQYRIDVFTKDNFTCQECFTRGVKIEAHHLKSFASILKDNNIFSISDALQCSELWNINNGQTLCKECHKKTDSYLYKKIL
jgi:hypothetical protein